MKPIKLGIAGENAARNIRLYRQDHNLSYAELSRRLAKHHRDIAPDALSQIEDGKRRVDVDDLYALSLVFDVSPLWFLLPHHVRVIEDDRPLPQISAGTEAVFNIGAHTQEESNDGDN